MIIGGVCGPREGKSRNFEVNTATTCSMENTGLYYQGRTAAHTEIITSSVLRGRDLGGGDNGS